MAVGCSLSRVFLFLFWQRPVLRGCCRHDNLPVAPAELKRHVVIEPIALTSITALKTPGLSQELRGAVCPEPQDLYHLSLRVGFLQELQQTPQSGSPSDAQVVKEPPRRR